MGSCTGCPLMIHDEATQRALKLEDLRERHGLSPDRIETGPPLGYRVSSKRVVGGSVGAVRLGSYVAGTHVVADMTACRVDHPRIAAAFDELTRVADAAGIEPYDELAHRGDLRYAWAKTDGERVLLTLITAAEESMAVRVLPERLAAVAGIAHSVQAATGNAIRGGPARPVRGLERLAVRVLDGELEVGPLGFLQPNLGVAELAYADLCRRPDGSPARGELAFDLFAGSGALTRHLRRTFAHVDACEAFPESARALGLRPERAEEFLDRRTREGARPDLVVANPPRAGLGVEACRRLVATSTARVTIMSCNPASLVRDLDRLTPAYVLAGLRAYDTLPQTRHVELVAWLERSAPAE
jgi:23S rRNA (uracil1939-C5)-methyltransferase